MCGVLGIMGDVPIITAVEMLQLLTHRGQDCAGIAWIPKKRKDGRDLRDWLRSSSASELKVERRSRLLNSLGKVCVSKSMGFPTTLPVPGFEAAAVLVGSTRYPTVGKEGSKDTPVEKFSQPFAAEVKNDQVALVHNGNITNFSELINKRFPDKEYYSDSELIVDLLALELKRSGGNLVEAIRSLSQSLDGAYSIVGIYEGNLFAYRDPLGFKPLTFAQSDHHVIFASESVVFQHLSIRRVRDVQPGELVIVKPRDSLNEEEEEEPLPPFELESHIIKKISSPKHCMFEYVYFAHAVSKIDEKLVYDVRLELGRRLARRIQKMNLEIDFVVPVPDTARVAVQAISEELGIPVRELIIKNRYYLHRTFILKNENERRAAVGRKYLYLPDLIKESNVLIVDDSIVRGLTCKKMIAEFRKLGASKVYFASTCPPITHPCYYGIDFTRDKELLASNRTLEEIKHELWVDELIYQTIDDLVAAIGTPHLCLACVTGNYPTPVARKIRKKVELQLIDGDQRPYE